jgi:hypothetical protein
MSTAGVSLGVSDRASVSDLASDEAVSLLVSVLASGGGSG